MADFINNRYQVELIYSEVGDQIRVWDHFTNESVRFISLSGVSKQYHQRLKKEVSDLIRSIT